MKDRARFPAVPVFRGCRVRPDSTRTILVSCGGGCEASIARVSIGLRVHGKLPSSAW
jgi:hypothetical protein